MQLANPDSEIFVPDGLPPAAALERTTTMGVSAHQDDLEILAYSPIVSAFGADDEWFTGVTVTNGSGAPRDNIYAKYTDEEMVQVRCREQKKAAVVGEYAAVALLDYTSAQVKTPGVASVLADLEQLIAAARPKVIYTHNLADKHDTHVAVALRLLQVLRGLPAEQRPQELLGCEVWRDLDWMCDEDKEALRTDSHDNLAAALLGVYDSQVVGGKRYDLATMGRRCSHATFHASHDTDVCSGLTFAMDLTPLMNDAALDPAAYVREYIERFSGDVMERIAKLG